MCVHGERDTRGLEADNVRLFCTACHWRYDLECRLRPSRYFAVRLDPSHQSWPVGRSRVGSDAGEIRKASMGTFTQFVVPALKGLQYRHVLDALGSLRARLAVIRGVLVKLSLPLCEVITVVPVAAGRQPQL
jgi:hypothetical protein